MLIDSGASHHFIPTRLEATLTDIHRLGEPFLIGLPDGSTSPATHRGKLPLPTLPSAARDCLLMPAFEAPLLSVKRLCDTGHEVYFTKNRVLVLRDGEVVLVGVRSSEDGLWSVPLPVPLPAPPSTPSASSCAHNAAPLTTAAHRVAWAHAALGSPAESTLLNALKKGYIQLDGLSESTLSRHPPHSLATAKGHLALHRKGQRPSRLRGRRVPARTSDPGPDPISDTVESLHEGALYLFYLDSTGALPVVSARGAGSILVLADADTGYIHLEPVIGRTGPALTRAFKDAIQWFREHTVFAKRLRMDNELSREMRQVAKSFGLDLELCPPGNHRANAAERHIRTLKDHFTSVLATTDPCFPATAWDLLLPQTELTLNVLRPCASDSSISAWERVCGPWDFSARPIAPMGTRVLIFEGRDDRRSWEPHGKEGWYVGPAQEHYRCYRVLVEDTHGVRVSDTLSWHPSRLVFPRETIWEALTDAVLRLGSALEGLRLEPEALSHPILQPEALSTLRREFARLGDILSADATTDQPHPASSPATDTDGPSRSHLDVPEPPLAPARLDVPEQPLAPTRTTSDVSAPPLATSSAETFTLPGAHSRRRSRRRRKRSRDHTPADPTPASTPPPDVPAHAPILPPAPDVVSNNPCRVCLQDDGLGLLCDDCEACWHAGCIGLCHIPRGGWICPRCRAHSSPSSGKQGVGTELCRACDHPGSATVGCASCRGRWHAHCLGLRYRPTAPWTCPRCRPPPRDARGRLALSAHKQGVVATPVPSLLRQPLGLNDIVGAFLTDHLSRGHAFAAGGPRLTFRKALQGDRADAFQQALRREHDTLFEPGRDGKPCLEFVPWSSLPVSCRPSRYVLVARDKNLPDGSHKAKMRGTFDGSTSTYAGPVAADTADILLVRAHWHACLARGWHRATVDISAFYVGTPMDHDEWMEIRLSQLPQDLAQSDRIRRLCRGDRLLVRVRKGIYGLPQAGRLARERLVKHLTTAGYHEHPHVPSLFSHASGRLRFVLTVDDFDVGYERQEDFDHLRDHLAGLYSITFDLEGRRYLGIDTAYDRQAGTLRLSMDTYYAEALDCLGVKRKGQPPGIPMPHTPPAYGKRGPQFAYSDSSPDASSEEQKYLQRCIGTWLYAARWVDPILLPALSRLATQQTAPTRRTMADLDLLLQYIAWTPPPAQTLRRTEMLLIGAADASFASEPGSRSRAGGILWVGNRDGSVHAPLLCISALIPIVVASAAEAEYAALYKTGTSTIWARTVLDALGFPQASSPGTPLLTDNDCAKAIANRTCKLRRTKALDVRLHWTRDRVDRGLFRMLRCAGPANPADFLTKGHAASHLREVRPMFVDTPPDTVSAFLPLAQTPEQLRASRRVPPSTESRLDLESGPSRTAPEDCQTPLLPFHYQSLSSSPEPPFTAAARSSSPQPPFAAAARPETARFQCLKPTWAVRHPWVRRHPGGTPGSWSSVHAHLQLGRSGERSL